MFEAPHTVQSGETITLRAWTYLEFSANYADYMNLLAALRAGASQAEPDHLQQSLLERVMAASVRANDLDLIAVADVPGILETIFDLNRVEEMAAKPLGLHSRVVLAMESAQAKAKAEMTTA
jgi:uncharacterized membrane protein